MRVCGKVSWVPLGIHLRTHDFLSGTTCHSLPKPIAFQLSFYLGVVPGSLGFCFCWVLRLLLSTTGTLEPEHCGIWKREILSLFSLLYNIPVADSQALLSMLRFPTRLQQMVFPVFSYDLLTPNRTQIWVQPRLTIGYWEVIALLLPWTGQSSWVSWGSQVSSHRAGYLPEGSTLLTQLSDQLRHVWAQLRFNQDLTSL